MSTFVLLATVVVVLAVALGVTGLLANRPPLLDPPGPIARLTVYLTRNVAETGGASAFPELRDIVLHGEPELLLEGIAAACRDLGWEDVTVDTSAARVTAVVRTRMLGFRDDVEVRLVAHEAGAREVPAMEARVRSRSRVGRGDLAANARHVMDLRAQLSQAGLIRVESTQ